MKENLKFNQKKVEKIKDSIYSDLLAFDATKMRTFTFKASENATCICILQWFMTACVRDRILFMSSPLLEAKAENLLLRNIVQKFNLLVTCKEI